MAKRKKKKEARMTEEQRAVEEMTDLVLDLGCPHNATARLAELCARVVEDLDEPYSYAHLAIATWGAAEAPPNEIEVLAREVIAEIERHARAMEALLARMDPLLDGEEEDHTDLDPEDVMKRIEPLLRGPDEVDAAR